MSFYYIAGFKLAALLLRNFVSPFIRNVVYIEHLCQVQVRVTRALTVLEKTCTVSLPDVTVGDSKPALAQVCAS